MLSLADRSRRRVSRALLIASASAALAGLALPATAAQAAVTSPSSHSSRVYEECYDYNNKRHGNHYYEYCYDYTYRDLDRDRRHDRDERYYKGFELFYYYLDSHREWQFDSCYYDTRFGFDHPNHPYKAFCDYDDDRDHDGRHDRDGHDDLVRHRDHDGEH